MSSTTCYLNGDYLPLAEARVSPLDRGFLFGDGAYEVIPVYSRRPFRIGEHLRRLQQTLDGIRLVNPHTVDEWAERIARIVAAAPFADQSVYLQVTRGADTKRDHAFPKDVAPTVFIFTAPLTTTPDSVRASGVAAVTAPDERWARCDLKVVALLANVLARQHAVDQGCAETILLRDGCMIEGAASNIFVVRGGVLLAPPKDRRMLPGITYDVVLELAAAHGVPYAVRDIAEAELRSADEVWMTSSTKEVLAITTLDGEPVGAGVPGPLAQRMHDWYQLFKDEVMRRG
ncbi:D-amino acid aminotransferase [Azospira restricta]|uniref:D-amino acid aminotransferase n=1 Tax=Azospira restricta TaxID=404405 RepID=A0A974Y4F8_9RHOO|nr:D-amino acid aminotransferase [Azospira restricta]QRJ64489.1 D-amino acid aminotransferase [Azospira restricta]